ncbi:MAG: hypothetical protein ABR501_12590, partial [Pyrinomonadaceae bacterium]
MRCCFAPAGRDVYSYENLAQGLAPSGAKPGSGSCAVGRKAVTLLQELLSKTLQAINMSPLWG